MRTKATIFLYSFRLLFYLGKRSAEACPFTSYTRFSMKNCLNYELIDETLFNMKPKSCCSGFHWGEIRI